MRLLGVFDRFGSERLILQNSNRFFIKDKNDCNEKFENYSFIKNRDGLIGGKEIDGPDVFNFRYGPVSAGVAEAGVFNIYTYGERIISVNIDPTYKKRDIENMMTGRSIGAALKLAETVCGNFAFSHSLAFSRAVEKIAEISADEPTCRLKIVALELERIYNHIYLIAQLSKGAAQNVLTSHLEWIFEECLRINELFSGDRFLKGINAVGMINFSRYDLLNQVSRRIKEVKQKFLELYPHSLKSWNFVDRICGTAVLSGKKAQSIGITGPSLRAAGVKEDLRIFEKLYGNLNLHIRNQADVLARMEVRSEELIDSCDMIVSQIEKIGQSMSKKHDRVVIKDGSGIGFAESPSGVVAYYLDIRNGLVDYVYIITPSVFGFKAFTDAFAGHIFTDFSFAFDSFGINFADCAR